ncbi:hypothetical protein JCM8208_003993 [Rhodotorula glutinis]
MDQASASAAADAATITTAPLAHPEREHRDTEGTGDGSSHNLSQAGQGGMQDGDKAGTHAQDDGDDDNEQPAAKKRRTSTKGKSTARVKGKKGKLSRFLAMPLDILIEIAQHVDPPTLLAMSRTNQLMYNLFARRSAAPIWAAVRRNVDFPDLEATDLSETQLASLVYDRNCHLCGRGRASIVDYSLRIRWCKPCQRANLVREGDIERQKPAVHVHKLALACSFFTLHSGKNRNTARDRYYCLSQANVEGDRLYKLAWAKNDDLNDALLLDSSRAKPRTAEEILYADPTSLNLVEKYVVDRRGLVKLVQEDAAALVKWDGATSSEREEAYANSRVLRGRKAVVKQELLVMGYADADIVLGYRSPITKIISEPTLPEQLSDEDWDSLMPTIIEDADRCRVERLDLERIWRIWRRHDALRPRYSFMRSTGNDQIRLSIPSWANFRLLPSVERLWVPEGDVVSDEQWQAALPSILADLDTARRVLKVGYARHLVQSLVGAGAISDASLVDKLEKPEKPLKPTGILFDATDFGDFGAFARFEREMDRMYSDGPDGFLDFGDMADGVDEADLDALLSQAVATFIHAGSGEQATLVPHPDIVRKLDEYGGFQPEDISGDQPQPPSVQFVQQQLDVLKRAGLPNHRSSIAKLEELGPVFECYGCDADGKSGSLSWSEMIHHACKIHPKVYAASDSNRPATVPEIRLSTSTYPTFPGPPSTTTTVAADLVAA